jgi:prepilin-type N-terminal cleavage/methylation domain-containing protein
MGLPMKIKNRKQSRGFTIIEILVALALAVGVVALLSKGIAAGVNKAKIQQASLVMNGRIQTAAIAYLLSEPNTTKSELKGEELGLTAEEMKDPWGDPYTVKYVPKDKQLTITADGAEAKKHKVGKVEVDMRSYM